MATATTPKKEKKDEGFLDKLGGTLARKKKTKEAEEIAQEGKHAIESPTSPTNPNIGPEGYLLDETEERSMIEPLSRENPKVKELINMLIDWVNDELAEYRIIIRDLQDDLFDGQILQKLIEKLAGIRVEVQEVSQSEIGQKQKLGMVLETINSMLNIPPMYKHQKWNVESIHAKNLVAILHLMVALAKHFRAPIRLPENVIVSVVVVQKRDGLLQTRKVQEEITSNNDDIGGRFGELIRQCDIVDAVRVLTTERDAFDTLFDHAPDKLNVVKKSLISFVNKHLNKINLEVSDLDSQFHDGVYLVLLMGLLEGYFVPLYSFHLTTTAFDHKVHNVSFAFELMQDAGLPKPKARPEDIVNLDLKSTLRVLYNLFTKYKAIS